LPGDASPIMSLALDDVRIAATGEPADRWLGLPLPSDGGARSGGGDVAIAREALDGRTYVGAYGVLYDVNGQLVGRLHVGVREDALTVGYYRATTLLLLLFLVATGVAAWIAVRGVRSVFKPIETIAAVARATQAGEDRRIGPI